MQLTIGDPLVAQFSCHTCSVEGVKPIAEMRMRSLSALEADRTFNFGGEGKRHRAIRVNQKQKRSQKIKGEKKKRRGNTQMRGSSLKLEAPGAVGGCWLFGYLYVYTSLTIFNNIYNTDRIQIQPGNIRPNLSRNIENNTCKNYTGNLCIFI